MCADIDIHQNNVLYINNIYTDTSKSIIQKDYNTDLVEAADVEDNELDVARGVGRQDDAVKDKQQLPVQLLGRLPL